MKRTRKIWLTMILGYIIIPSCFALEIPGKPTIFTDNQQKYVDPKGIDDPIRNGAAALTKNPDQASDKIEGIQGADIYIDTHDTAKKRTLTVVINLINYSLLLAALIALIYLIYHGVVIITATGDDAKYKEGLKGVKYAAIALIGIGLSWVMVSSIFWVIFEVLLKK